MEKIETLEAALKRIAELKSENEKLREELEYYKNRKINCKWKPCINNYTDIPKRYINNIFFFLQQEYMIK